MRCEISVWMELLRFLVIDDREASSGFAQASSCRMHLLRAFQLSQRLEKKHWCETSNCDAPFYCSDAPSSKESIWTAKILDVTFSSAFQWLAENIAPRGTPTSKTPRSSRTPKRRGQDRRTGSIPRIRPDRVGPVGPGWVPYGPWFMNIFFGT